MRDGVFPLSLFKAKENEKSVVFGAGLSSGASRRVAERAGQKAPKQALLAARESLCVKYFKTFRTTTSQ